MSSSSGFFGNGHFLHIRGTRGLVQTKRKGPSTQVELVNFLYSEMHDSCYELDGQPRLRQDIPTMFIDRMNRSEAFLDFAGMAALMVIFALIALYSPGLAYQHANRAIREAYGGKR